MKRLELEFTSDAIAIAELSTIPSGLKATDSATKAADVDILFAGSIHPGKFLLCMQGGVLETELALSAAKTCSVHAHIDSVHLPFPHPQLRNEQHLQVGRNEPALLSVETFTVPSLLLGLDRILKSTDCTLRLKHLGDHLGGKSLAVLDGELHDIQMAETLLRTHMSQVLISDIQTIARPSDSFVSAFLKSIR